MTRSIGFAFILSFFLMGCGAVPIPQADAERDREARLLVEDLAQGRDAALMAKMSSQVEPAEMAAQLPFMKSMVPPGPVPEGTTTGWRSNVATNGTTYVVARTYDYPDRVLNAETTFIREGESWKVFGFYVAPTMKPAQTESSAPIVVEEAPAV